MMLFITGIVVVIAVLAALGAVLWVIGIPLTDPERPLTPEQCDLTRVPAGSVHNVCAILAMRTGKPHTAERNQDGTFTVRSME